MIHHLGLFPRKAHLLWAAVGSGTCTPAHLHTCTPLTLFPDFQKQKPGGTAGKSIHPWTGKSPSQACCHQLHLRDRHGGDAWWRKQGSVDRCKCIFPGEVTGGEIPPIQTKWNMGIIILAYHPGQQQGFYKCCLSSHLARCYKNLNKIPNAHSTNIIIIIITLSWKQEIQPNELSTANCILMMLIFTYISGPLCLSRKHQTF